MYWRENVTQSKLKETETASLTKEETDNDIVEHYKTGEYTVIAKRINPYDKEQELRIVTFHDYKKFNEPPPVDCGTRATTCYILLKRGEGVEIIARVYSASSPFISEIEGDFVDKIINGIPLVRFVDVNNVVLRSVGGSASDISLIKLDLKTKNLK